MRDAFSGAYLRAWSWDDGNGGSVKLTAPDANGTMKACSAASRMPNMLDQEPPETPSALVIA